MPEDDAAVEEKRGEVDDERGVRGEGDHAGIRDIPPSLGGIPLN